MPEEGKLARAMAKAGAAERLYSSAVPVPAEPPSSAAPTPAPVEPSRRTDPSAIRRVTGRWEVPAQSVVLYHDRMGHVSSQIRALRAKILALNHGRPPQVITITSGSREEGKTTISMNLGAAFSEIDAGRILVLDGDLLRPSLHLLANVRMDGGMNDILANSLALDGNIYETAIPNLDIIPSRPSCVNNGYEPQLHQRLRELLNTLRRHYSFIIIDTPPVLAGSHACAFGKNSDGVLLVARTEKTPRQVVKRAMDELTNVGAKIAGCVLTHHEHHVPDLIYRLFGTTPAHYYRYGRDRVDPVVTPPEEDAMPVGAEEKSDG